MAVHTPTQFNRLLPAHTEFFFTIIFYLFRFIKPQNVQHKPCKNELETTATNFSSSNIQTHKVKNETNFPNGLRLHMWTVTRRLYSTFTSKPHLKTSRWRSELRFLHFLPEQFKFLWLFQQAGPKTPAGSFVVCTLFMDL